MVRHATVQATRVVFNWLPHHNRFIDKSLRLRRACDWEETIKNLEENFDALDAVHLLDGRPVELPTCPACGALLDLALELDEHRILREEYGGTTDGAGQDTTWAQRVRGTLPW